MLCTTSSSVDSDMSLSISSVVSNLFGGQELIDLLLSLPAILLGICFHEYSHARVAYYFGDSTAKDCGRMTLNPLKHFHPVGFLLLLFARVGFARPVPINPNNFRNPKRDEILVSLAGPAANVCLVIVSAAMLKAFMIICRMQGLLLEQAGSIYFMSDTSYYVYLVLFYCIMVNLSLAVFNMLPLPPLDGSHLLTVIMPMSWRRVYHRIQPFMPYIFVLAWATGGLGWLVSKPVGAILDFIMNTLVI